MFNVTDKTAAPYFKWRSYSITDGYVLTAPTDRETKANPWGFVDILGNVNEWMLNRYDPEFYTIARASEPISVQFDNRSKGDGHSLRGGCWDSSPGQANLYVRNGYQRQTDVIGFRVLRYP
jgi:formylglycine-generating enzyme required for sulfatase activity